MNYFLQLLQRESSRVFNAAGLWQIRGAILPGGDNGTTRPPHSSLPGRENENKAAIVSARQRVAAPLSVGLAGLECEHRHPSPSLALSFIRGID